LATEKRVRLTWQRVGAYSRVGDWRGARKGGESVGGVEKENQEETKGIVQRLQGALDSRFSGALRRVDMGNASNLALVLGRHGTE